MQNQAVFLHGVNDMRLGEHAAMNRVVGEGEVRVEIKALGICGSDVHYYRKMRCGDFVVDAPMVIGHESAGVVTEVGSGVNHLEVGDRVALEPGIPCGKCKLCRTGRYNLCPEMRFFATPPVHGSLAHHVIHPADFCYPLPAALSLAQGAMCEPLSVGVHACNRAGVCVGSRVLVLGAGPIGLCALLVAKAYGASCVVITDVDPKRLAVAESLGAIPLSVVGKTPAQTDAEVRVLFGGAQPEVSLDCVGFTDSMSTALTTTESGGKCCLVGMGHAEMSLPITSSSCREVDLIGVFRYRNTYETCIELMSSGKIDVAPLLTHSIDLTAGLDIDQVVRGFELAAKGGDAIKVMFHL